MEIVKERSGDLLSVRVSGRLDNHWSVPFDETLAEIIREGAHHVRLDMTEVNYLSSAGIGVLVKAHQDVGKLQGTLLISAASERVRSVLKLVNLDTMLFATGPVPEEIVSARSLPRQLPSEMAIFECYSFPGKASEYRLLGDPATLAQGAYGETHAITAREDLFALGLGAFGRNYDECRNLFGEFMAAGGSAAFMPTDDTSTPDYMTSSGELVPEIQALYGIVFRGTPCHLLRFDNNVSTGGVPLSEIARVCSLVAETPQFGMVMAAEVSGLVCAILRRSPVQLDAARFDFPGIRDWLSFTPEREHARTSSIVVGIASTWASGDLKSFLRPVSNGFSGHFHAAVTAFRALPRGKVQISEVLAQAFQPRSVHSVVHLLRDARPIEGAGESEFLRGACWVFPLTGGAA